MLTTIVLAGGALVIIGDDVNDKFVTGLGMFVLLLALSTTFTL